MTRIYQSLSSAIEHSVKVVQEYGAEVNPGHWQGVDTSGHPDMVTKEVINWAFAAKTIHDDLSHRNWVPYWQQAVGPNLPWADDHFMERVSREPSNPGVEYRNWPWWRDQEAVTAAAVVDPESPEFAPANFKFDHTYQERFWPKGAGVPWPNVAKEKFPRRGIRYPYGDLDDVVNLLYREPGTRQAYLPIYFPEDTGSVHTGRTPCTLGYHFMVRNNQMHLWYTIRSCDVVRHFRDDVYLALRLLKWVLDELIDKELRDDSLQVWNRVDPGYLFFNAFSFHYHMGDAHLLRGGGDGTDYHHPVRGRDDQD